MSYPYAFTVKNQTASVTLTLYQDPWDPIGVSGVPAPSTPPLTIAPGATANFLAAGHGGYATYNVASPTTTYPKLRIRWVGVGSGVALPGGPTGQWQSSPIPTNIYYDETDRITDHVLYIKDGTPSKIKRGLLKAGTPAPAEEVAAIKRAEKEFRKRQVEERVNERRAAAASASGGQEKREAKPLGRFGRV
ncbi:hypothetical protein TWF281_004172 [Arthrobotrys megalospora]